MKCITILTLALKIEANDMNAYLFSCPVNHEILYLIASVERSKKRELGYPYLISFNSKKEKKQAKKIAKFIWIDNRTVDCLDAQNCTQALSFLLENKIINLDIGPYQLNYKYHKLKLSDYFNVKQSYIYACNLIYNNIKKYGYSWDTIAKYHSYTKKHKEKYLKLLARNIKKIKNEVSK